MYERLLEVAEQMIQEQGLNGVSFQDLADAVGVSKASVFHEIKNKQLLAVALIRRRKTKYNDRYARVAACSDSAPEKLKQIAANLHCGLRRRRTCLLTALAASINMLSSDALKELPQAVVRTAACLSAVFDQGREEGSLEFQGDPESSEIGYFTLLQGLQVLLQAKGDHSALEGAAAVYIDAITCPEALFQVCHSYTSSWSVIGRFKQNCRCNLFLPSALASGEIHHRARFSSGDTMVSITFRLSHS